MEVRVELIAGPFTSTRKLLIRVPNARVAFAKVLPLFFPEPVFQAGIHPTAIVAASAQVDSTAHIGPFCVIGEQVRIGPRCVLQATDHVGANCQLGEETKLFPNVTLYSRTEVGCRVRIHSGAVIGADGFGFYPLSDGSYRKIPQVGRVVIGDAVEIGANTCIDRATMGDTIIEAGVKLDNLVHIGHNSIVGTHSVLAGQVGLSGSVHVGSRVRMGGQVGIADHITVGDKVSISAQAGVLSDLEPGATVYGTPALPGPVAKRMHLYSLRLGELFQQVKQLQRRLDELEGREKRS